MKRKKKKSRSSNTKTASAKKAFKLSKIHKILIVSGSILLGLGIGFLWWFYISRCVRDTCFFYYWPLKEMLVCGLFAGIIPFVFFGEIQPGRVYRGVNNSKKRNKQIFKK